MAVPAGDRPDLSYRLCFIWRAGVGTDRQPRHLAASRIRRRGPEPAWVCQLFAGSDGVLAGPKRLCDSGRLLGGGRAVAASDPGRHSAVEPAFPVRTLSFTFLRRSGIYGLSVGSAFARNRFPCAASEYGDQAGHMVAPLDALPFHVSFGGGQAPEWRSHLGQPLCALLLFSNRAATNTA